MCSWAFAYPSVRLRKKKQKIKTALTESKYVMSWSLRTHKEMPFHTVEPAPLRASVKELHFVSYVPEDAKICKSRQKGQKTRLM